MRVAGDEAGYCGRCQKKAHRNQPTERIVCVDTIELRGDKTRVELRSLATVKNGMRRGV